MGKFDDISFYGHEDEELQKEWERRFPNMTQEEKQLLLKDLCERLPYGVKVVYTTLSDNMPKVWDMTGLPGTGFVDIIVPGRYRFAAVPVEEIKPYLRPMSSMTEEEEQDYASLSNHCISTSMGFAYLEAQVLVEWLNFHHFDFRNLIERGLALEAPEGMYNADTEEEEVKVEIPNTVEEALAILDKTVSEEDMEWMKKRGAISVHLTLGMWIRNNWGFWENSDFYQYLCEKTGLTHPDDISNYIIEEFIKWKLGK